MTKRPPFEFEPPRPEKHLDTKDRSPFVFFPPAPEPVHTEPFNGMQRYVDIGQEHWQMILDNIAEIRNLSGVEVKKPFTLQSTLAISEWQRICFGPARQNKGEEAFRGYLMIEPENLFDIIARLNYLGKKRLLVGKHLEYKWRQPMFKNEIRKGKLCQIGYVSYIMSQPITLYTDSLQELKEIMTELALLKWDPIEDTKKNLCNSIKMSKPNHGQKRFILDGTEYLTMEYNEQPGFSEDL